MKNRNYSNLEDFLSDESFRNWVLGEKWNDSSNWDQWIEQNPEKKVLVDSAIQVIRGLPFRFAPQKVDPIDKNREWNKLRARAYERNTYHIWKIAAAFALIITLGFLVRQEVLRKMVVYSTPFGEQLHIVLPDSTTVNLNANSVLKYRKHQPREIWLDGEAFFHVKKKPQSGANFRVITNDMTIEVLGTSFNVIEKENRTEIILEEGSVTLNLERDHEKIIQMVPGELVAFSRKSTETIERRSVRTKPLTSWKDGVLKFDDVPLALVMKRIEEIYGWSASYDRDELQARNISIPLPSDDLDVTLNLLSKAIGIEIEKIPGQRVLLLK